MPVEIRELVIRAVAQDAPEPTAQPQESIDSNDLIDICVARVLQILKDEKDR